MNSPCKSPIRFSPKPGPKKWAPAHGSTAAKGPAAAPRRFPALPQAAGRHGAPRGAGRYARGAGGGAAQGRGGASAGSVGRVGSWAARGE